MNNCTIESRLVYLLTLDWLPGDHRCLWRTLYPYWSSYSFLFLPVSLLHCYLNSLTWLDNGKMITIEWVGNWNNSKFRSRIVGPPWQRCVESCTIKKIRYCWWPNSCSSLTTWAWQQHAVLVVAGGLLLCLYWQITTLKVHISTCCIRVCRCCVKLLKFILYCATIFDIVKVSPFCFRPVYMIRNINQLCACLFVCFLPPVELWVSHWRTFSWTNSLPISHRLCCIAWDPVQISLSLHPCLSSVLLIGIHVGKVRSSSVQQLQPTSHAHLQHGC